MVQFEILFVCEKEVHAEERFVKTGSWQKKGTKLAGLPLLSSVCQLFRTNVGIKKSNTMHILFIKGQTITPFSW